MLPEKNQALQALQHVANQQSLGDLAERLKEVRHFLSDELQDIEQFIQTFDTSEKPLALEQASKHLLQLPGKRLRSLCVVLAAKLLGKPYNDTVRNLAVACELVHTATLLHDDVIDDASERRGAKAARILYGNSISILAGDHLLVEALRLVHAPMLLQALLQVISQMVAAEAIQLERRGRFEPQRAAYLQVIEGKTAALFAWGLQAGTLGEPIEATQQQALRAIGFHLGMAFQLIDDVLDFSSDAQTLGKDVLVDIKEGKLTWPLIVAAEKDATIEQTLLAGDIEALAQKIKQSGALDETKNLARDHAQQAMQALSHFHDNAARQAMAWVIESAVSRIY